MRDPRQNPFLVLGVSSDAEMSEIQSVGKRRLMMLRLDEDADPAIARRIDAALDTLADPVERFEWGLLAPELTAEEAEAFRGDPVLSTLTDDPLQDGRAAYERLSQADSPGTYAHNLGVLKFVRAVAATEEAQKGTPDDISDDLACISLWKIAFRDLRTAFGSEKFWMRQRLRAKELDDQRLDSTRVKRIQTDIFKEIVDPVGVVIKDALIARHGKVAKAYVDLVRSAGFDPRFVEAVLSDVYQPLADRVEAVVGVMRKEFDELDTESEGSHGLQQIITRFESEVVPDLDVMLEVGDLPGYAEEHARDTAAELLRTISIASWNRSQDVELAKRASAWAIKYVDSSSLSSQINEDIEFLKTARPLDKKAAALQAEALAAVQSGSPVKAIKVLERLLGHLNASPQSHQEEILATRSALAVQLYNRAVEIAAPEKTGEMRRLLSRALELESDESNRQVIRQTLSQIPTAGQKFVRGAGSQALGLVAQLAVYGILALLCAGLSQCN